MAKGFNLTAQINLRGPSNLKPIVAEIRRELGSVSTNVKLNLNAKSAKSIDIITSRLQAMNGVLVQAKQNTDSLNSALQNLSSSLGTVQSAGSKTSTSINNTASSAKNAAKNIRLASTEMEEFGRQSALAVRRFAAFSLATAGIYGLINAINDGFKAFINFDKELIKLQQVTGKGTTGIALLEKTITSLSTTLGVSSESLISVASTLAQAGLSADDTRIALAALAKTELAPSFDNLTDTTEGAIAALRQFELQAGDLEGALGSINAVAAAFAVESKDIIAAIQRTGGVFAAASKGVSQGTDALNEFVAIFTSVRQTTRESAETIATGLRTIFTRIQRARTIDQLREFGVELTDLEGKFVGPYEAIKRLSQGLKGLDPRDLRFSQIVEELGGFRQIGKVIPLIQQFTVAQEALKIAQKGQGSLTEAQVTAQKSLANQLSKVREQFLALIRDVGKSSAFQGLFKIVTGLASGLISLASAFKPILPMLAIIGTIKGISAIGQFGTGFVGGLRKGGANSTGNNLGSSLSGAKDKDKTDITNKASQAIIENTGAIKTLTSSLNDLSTRIDVNTNAINSRNKAGGFNKGGSVRAFASGGYVPGSGNRDTVPAVLTPGEFVIRKKAVETIGADNLHRMNKYAKGGAIKKMATGGITVKADVPEPSLLDTSLIGSTWSKLVSNIGRRFSPNGKIKQREFSNLDTRQQGAIKGYVFEEALRAAGQGADTAGGDFDYRSWKKNKSFNKLDSGDIVDAKLSAAKVNKAEFAKKIGNLQANNPDIDISKSSFGAAVFDPSVSDFDLTVPLNSINKYQQKKHLGGLIRKFTIAGPVSSTGGKPASRSDILRALGASAAAETAGVSSSEIYELLGKRNPNDVEKTMIEAVQKEYLKKTNRTAGAAKGLSTRLQNQGLTFAAAGMFGKPFGATNAKIESPSLSSSPMVRMIGGVLNPEVAKELDNIFNDSISKTTSRATQAVMKGYNTSDIISEITPNLNTDSSIQGGLLERVIQELGGPGAVKGLGFDFPKGLKGAAKYFNLPEDIPTDLKRTISGPSTIKDNIVTYLKNVLGYAKGGSVQKFASGGLAKAPLVDDILQASGAILPKPSHAIAALINAGGGAVDVDRTLKRTLGDKAYSSAPSSKAKQAVLSKYFRDDQQRLQDMKSAPLTAFGQELISSIRSGQLDPNSLSIISKSQRTKGVPEHLHELFGIPIENMIFTQGGDKQPALDAIRSKGPRANRVRKALGGFIQRLKLGGEVTEPELYRRGGLTYSVDDIKAAAQKNNVPYSDFISLIEERKNNINKDFVIPDLREKFGLSPYNPQSAYLSRVESASMEKESRIASWREKQGLSNRDYEGQTKEQKELRASRGIGRRFANGGSVYGVGGSVRNIRGLFSDADVAKAAKKQGMTFKELKAKLEARRPNGDYEIYDWDIEKTFGLSASKVPDSMAFAKAAGARDREKTQAYTDRISRLNKNLGGSVQKFANGGSPVDTLEKYYKDSGSINLGLANSKSLSKDQRKSLASDVKNLRKLKSGVPDKVYSAISSVAFDSMAQQIGFNKAASQGVLSLTEQDALMQQEAIKTIGKKFSLPGFLSTSKEFSVAKSFLDNAPRTDKFGALLDINTKKQAQGIDTVASLGGKKIDVSKTEIDPRSGKSTTYQMNQPDSEKEVILQPRSRFGVQSAKFAGFAGGNKNLWLGVQQFAQGGKTELPDVNTVGSQLAEEFKLAKGKNAWNQLDNNCLSIARKASDMFGYVADEENIRRQIGTFQQLRLGKNSPFGLKPTEETLKKSSSLRRMMNNPTLAASTGNIIVREGEEMMKHVSFEHMNKEYNFGAAGVNWPIALRIPLKRKEQAKFANGGSPEDTVPALLTPGEFVINKKAAKKIGYAHLHKMNKADKIQGFNKGGSVGGIAKFAAGGRLGDASNDSKEYWAYKAQKAGMNSKEYTKSAANKVSRYETEIVKEQANNKKDLVYNFQGQSSTTGRNLKDLRSKAMASGKKGSPEYNKYKDEAEKAVEDFSEQLRQIAPSMDPKKLKQAATELAQAMMDGKDVNRAIAEKGSSLAEVFSTTIGPSEALELALEKTAKDLGDTVENVRGNIGKNDLRRQRFIESDAGQSFGKLSKYAPDAAQRFSQSKIGKNTIGAADALSGKGLPERLEKSFGKIGGLIGDKINALGGPIVALGTAASVLGEKLPDLLGSKYANSETAAGVAGGIGGAGKGLASGALLGGQIAGPVGAMIAGITGAIVGGISGAFEAFNQKKLENNLKVLEKTSGDLSAALKRLSIDANQVNLQSAKSALQSDLQGVENLGQQAQFGAGGSSRGWLEFLRNIDKTGTINSVTGGNQEVEARQGVVAGIERAFNAANIFGDKNRAGAPIEQIRGLLDRANQAEKDAGGGEAGRKAKDEILAQGNQSYQQLRMSGATSDSIYLAAGIKNAQQQGKDYTKDLKTPEGNKKLREEGQRALALEEEAASKQELLSDAMRNVVVQSDNLIEMFRKAQASLERFGQGIENIKISANNKANALRGQASVGNVNRTSEQVLGNISAYSMDEVSAVADQTAQLAGGGDEGKKLGDQIKANKLLTDELPRLLKGANGNNVGGVVKDLEKMFKEAQLTASPELFNNIEQQLNEKLAGRDSTSTSDIAEELDVVGIASKTNAEAMKVAIAFQKQYNDAFQTVIDLTNNYGQALKESTEWTLKAADIRTKADIQLAETLGKSLSLNEQNAPQQQRILGLTNGVVQGGSTDPNKIAVNMTAAIAKLGEQAGNNKPATGMYAELEQAQAGGDPQAISDQMALIAKQNNAINNSRQALEELANDGSAAANALKGLQEQQKMAAGSVNFLQKVLTSDATELDKMNKGLAAYTKLVSGKANTNDVNSLQFRQQAFGGLQELQGVLPESVFNQMQAKMSMAMIDAMPGGKEMLDKGTGALFTNEDGKQKEMTFRSALKMRSEGKDPVQQQFIDAYNKAVQAQQDAASRLAQASTEVATTFKDAMTTAITEINQGLSTLLEKAKTETEAKVTPEVEVPKTNTLVKTEEELNKDAAGKDVLTMGLKNVDTSIQNLTLAIKTLIAALALATAAFAAYKGIQAAGGVGNAIAAVTGVVRGGRRRTGFGGGSAPKPGSVDSNRRRAAMGLDPKTAEQRADQRKKVAERSQKPLEERIKERKPKTPDPSSPSKLPRRDPGASPTTTPSRLPRRDVGVPSNATGSVGPIPNTPVPAPIKATPANAIKTATAAAGALIDKAADAVSVVDEVVGVTTAATNIVTGQGTVQDVVYGASDAAELAGRGGGLMNFLSKIPGVGAVTKAVTGAGSAVAGGLGLGGLGTTVGNIGTAAGVGKPILGATGGVGAGVGNFAALNTAISAITNAVEFASDPAAYNARKQAESDAGLERAQQRTGYGELALDSLSGGLQGFMDPIGKIVEGAYVAKDYVKAENASHEAQMKTDRMTTAAETQISQSRGGGAISKLNFSEQQKAMEEARLQTEVQTAQKIQTSGGSIGDFAKAMDINEADLGGVSLQDLIAKKQTQLQQLPQDRINSREKAKDGTWDWSSNLDPKGFADAVSQEIQFRLSQIQLPPIPVKPTTDTASSESSTKTETPENTTKIADTNDQISKQKTEAQTDVKTETAASPEVKNTAGTVMKKDDIAPPESCECKILSQILAELQKATNKNQTVTPTSLKNEIIPAPPAPGTTSSIPTTSQTDAEVIKATEPQVSTEPQASTEMSVSLDPDRQKVIDASRETKQQEIAKLKKQIEVAKKNVKRNKLNGSSGTKSEEFLSNKENKLASAEKDLSLIDEAESGELEDVRKSQQQRADLSGKQIQYTTNKATQPQIAVDKKETKPLSAYDSARKQKREGYLSEKQSRREAYLSRFRPEVRERKMTKEEKAARDRAETQATAQAVGGTQNPVSATPPSGIATNEMGLAQDGTFSIPLKPQTQEEKDRDLQNRITRAKALGVGGQPVSSNIPKPVEYTRQVQSTENRGSLDGGVTKDKNTMNGMSTTITVDPSAQTFLDGLNTAFKGFDAYISRLESVASIIPNKIELTGTYQLQVQIQGAAALEGLDKRMKELAVSLIEPKLQQLRNEVSSATNGAVKSSTAIGNTK